MHNYTATRQEIRGDNGGHHRTSQTALEAGPTRGIGNDSDARHRLGVEMLHSAERLSGVRGWPTFHVRTGIYSPPISASTQMKAMARLARPTVEWNCSGKQMAYQRSTEMAVSVRTDTATETVCNARGGAVQGWSVGLPRLSHHGHGTVPLILPNFKLSISLEVRSGMSLMALIVTLSCTIQSSVEVPHGTFTTLLMERHSPVERVFKKRAPIVALLENIFCHLIGRNSRLGSYSFHGLAMAIPSHLQQSD